MRFLLLHPEDNALSSAWKAHAWDRVIDLGISGLAAYSEWEGSLGCKIEPYPSLNGADFLQLRKMFRFGCGRLVDRGGLDWWDLLSLRWLDQFEQVVLLSRLLATLSEEDLIFVSSNGAHARLLQALAPGRVHAIDAGQRSRPWHRLSKLSRLRFGQTLEIIGDKYDGSYRLRRFFANRRTKSSDRPVVLLPSAYGNASRTELAYAGLLPEVDFLLVTTRRSGDVAAVPDNVGCARLAAYAVPGPEETELRSLLRSWEELRMDLNGCAELAVLRDTGCFDSFPAYLRQGLAIRDCWINLFDTEPVAAVFSADEKNPYTRIPVLLAQQHGLPAIACHHGSLDGRYLFSDIAADSFLAKSRMESEYLVDVCGAMEDRVLVAPTPRDVIPTGSGRKNRIVFFSEPYEASNCRARHAYREILPGLARIAATHSCELVVKLHPFESLRERKRMVKDTVPGPERDVIQFVTGALTPGLMQAMWFSVTVSSSAAVDCAMQEIPSFLCTWLDRYGYGYAEQYAKFGFARALSSPEQIAEIPDLLRTMLSAHRRDVCDTTTSDLLRSLLFRDPDAGEIPKSITAEKLWA
ncbi:MAG TPA: hypothetical protein VF447_04475 [Terriglobales bacterium]